MKKATAKLDDLQFVAERRVTIAQQAYQFLRREIIDGRLAPRSPLSEQELSAQMGVSRTPVREALMKLADEGLVDIYPQFGTFVAPIKLSEVFDSQFVRELLMRRDRPRRGAPHRRAGGDAPGHDRGAAPAPARRRPPRLLRRRRAHATTYLMEVAGHPSVWHTVENA